MTEIEVKLVFFLILSSRSVCNGFVFKDLLLPHETTGTSCPRYKRVYLVIQSCLTLCDPKDYRPSGSSVHGILQERILEWVAFPPLGELSTQGLNSGLLHAGGFFTI